MLFIIIRKLSSMQKFFEGAEQAEIRNRMQTFRRMRLIFQSNWLVFFFFLLLLQQIALYSSDKIFGTKRQMTLEKAKCLCKCTEILSFSETVVTLLYAKNERINWIDHVRCAHYYGPAWSVFILNSMPIFSLKICQFEIIIYFLYKLHMVCTFSHQKFDDRPLF